MPADLCDGALDGEVAERVESVPGAQADLCGRRVGAGPLYDIGRNRVHLCRVGIVKAMHRGSPAGAPRGNHGFRFDVGRDRRAAFVRVPCDFTKQPGSARNRDEE